MRRFGPASVRRKSVITNLLKALRVKWLEPLTLPLLSGLERATRRFLDRQVAPRLIARGLNLVGFTLNFPQVYASVYAAVHLRHGFRIGISCSSMAAASLSLPAVYSLLTDLGIPGVVVVGEGEKKLERLVRTFEGLPLAEARTALATVAGLDPGIIVIGEADRSRVAQPGTPRHADQDHGRAGAARLRRVLSAALRRACADGRPMRRIARPPTCLWRARADASPSATSAV